MPLWTHNGSIVPYRSGGDMAASYTSFMLPASERITEYGTEKRPYDAVGKTSINFARMQPPTTGIAAGIEGAGAGVGRLIAGQAGADVGQAVGGLLGKAVMLPFDLLGQVPSIPILPGGFDIGAEDYLKTNLPNEYAALRKSHDEGGLGWLDFMDQMAQAKQRDMVEKGLTPRLLEGTGGRANLGGQISSLLNWLGVPGMAAQRTLLGTGTQGGGGIGFSRIDDFLSKPPSEISPELRSLQADAIAGRITRDELADRLVLSGQTFMEAGELGGFGWLGNMALSVVTDPLIVADFGVGIVASGSRHAALKAASAFGNAVGPERYAALLDNVAATTAPEALAKMTSDEIALEAMKLAEGTGGYADEIAQAVGSLSSRQRLLAGSEPVLRPVYNVIHKINEPWSMIGRRGGTPILNAHLSAEATRGAAAAYGIDNLKFMQDWFGARGSGQVFNESFGTFAANEGRFLVGDMLGRDVTAARGISSARPTDVVTARLERSFGKDFGYSVEEWMLKRRYEITSTGAGTREAAMDAARRHAGDQIAAMTGGRIDAAEIAELTARLDADQISLIDAAHFGYQTRRFLDAKRRAAGSRIRGGTTRTRAGIRSQVERATVLGHRELTLGRANELAEIIATRGPGAADAVRSAISRFDQLRRNFLTTASDEDILTGVGKWLEDNLSDLTRELTPDQIAALPRPLREYADEARASGYTLGLRPDDAAQGEWRIKWKEGPEGNQVVASANPWIDLTDEASAAYEPNAFGVLKESVTRGITTHRIITETQRAFREVVGDAQRMGRQWTAKEADEVFGAVMSRSQEVGIAPRGLMRDDYAAILKNLKGVDVSDVTIRDLQNAVVTAFEGRTMTVGLTQKFTGKVKTATSGRLGSVYLPVGAMAERMYPMIRFVLNPFFQFQEALEPYTFMAARGMKPGVQLGELDQEAYRITNRYVAMSDAAKFDMIERSNMILWGEKATDAFRGWERPIGAGRIRTGLSKLGYGMTPASAKQVAERRMQREFIGQEFRERINRIDPMAFAKMSALYGTTDAGEIAYRWLREADLWAHGDPDLSGLMADATKRATVGSGVTVNMQRLSKLFKVNDEDALAAAVRSGTLTRDAFERGLNEIGAHPEYVARAWTAITFEVEDFYDQLTALAAGGRKEVDAARSAVLTRADRLGVSEREYLAMRVHQMVLPVGSADFMGMSAAQWAQADAMFQLVRDPDRARLWQTGKAIDGTHKDIEEEWLRRAAPDDALKARLGPQAEFQPLVKVNFGGRSVYIPGGEAALRDATKEWTIWEHHLVRSQMIRPLDLTNLDLKVALYRKMWASHAIDLASEDAPWRFFNNVMMAMFSPNMKLTRNEMAATRLRANSMADVDEIARTADGIIATLGENATDNEIGLAFSTSARTGNYVPAGQVESFVGKEGVVRQQVTREALLRNADVAEQYATTGHRSGHDTTTSPLAQWIGDLIEEAVTSGRSWREAVPDWARVKTEDQIARMRVPRPPEPPPLDRTAPWIGDYDALVAANPLMKTTKKRGQDVVSFPAYGKDARDLIIKDYAGDPLGLARWIEEADYFARLKKYEGVGNEAAAMAARDDDVLQIVRGLRANVDDTRTVREALEKEYEDRLAELSPEELDEYERRIEALAVADGRAAKALYALMPGLAEADGQIIFKPWNWNGASDVAGRQVYAYLKNPEVKWRNMATNRSIGSAVRFAKSMSEDPDFYRLRPGETRDMFAERILNTTNGLAMKTGYFSVDLSGVEAFERGIMDTQMVGDITSWMYAQRNTAAGAKQWDEFYASLSAPRQAKIDKWIKAGAPSDPGEFAHGDAASLKISVMKTISPEQARAAAAAGTLRDTVEAKMRKQVASGRITQDDFDRFFQTYSTDADLVRLAGRDISMYGADYKVYDHWMGVRKERAIAGGETWLNEVGNGAYQWWLWDDFRNIYDPELSVANASHHVKGPDLAYVSLSDDIHKASGYLRDEGIPAVSEAGYSYLDPATTFLAQAADASASRVRGVTFLINDGKRLIGISEMRDRSTVMHELAHALFEQDLTESMQRVFIDDYNASVAQRSAQQVMDRADTANAYAATIQPRLRAQSEAAAAASGATESRAKARAASTAASRATRAREASEAALTKKQTETNLLRKQEAKRIVADADDVYAKARAAEKAAEDAYRAYDNEISKAVAAAKDADRGMHEALRLVKRPADLVPGSRIRITTHLMLSDLPIEHFVGKIGPLAERVGFNEYYINVPAKWRDPITKTMRDRSTRLAKRANEARAATRKAYSDLQKAKADVAAGRLSDHSPLIKRAEFDIQKIEGELAVAKRMEPLAWDEANRAKATADAAVESARQADEALAAARRAEADAEAAYNEAANRTVPPPTRAFDRVISEHFVEQFQVYLATGKAKNPKMRDAFEYFALWLRKVWDWLRANPDAKITPEVKSVFDDMFGMRPNPSANVVPFDATQEAMHQAGVVSAIRAHESAHTNVYFRRKRSWIERSANHPYFGLYPASYMWGKVLPEMIRFLAAEPFGVPAPMGGLLAAQRVWDSVEMQKDSDPEVARFMREDERRLRVGGMLFPATPFDIPVNLPLWSRRLGEWGLDSQDRVSRGEKPLGFDVARVASDVSSYAFGPASTLNTIGDLAKVGQDVAGQATESIRNVIDEQGLGDVTQVRFRSP